MPSILYGCEVVPFSQTAIDDIDRFQSALGKFTLGLPPCAPNISSSIVLGIPTFKEQLYLAQLRYLVRLFDQDVNRWSKDALLDHLMGDWTSPYVNYMGEIQAELNLSKWPSTRKEVQVTVENHFKEKCNTSVERLSLPALKPSSKRGRMKHVNESRESQVKIMIAFYCSISRNPFHFANASSPNSEAAYCLYPK